MSGNRPANDDHPAPAMYRGTRQGWANFSWKMEYHSRRFSAPAAPEAADVQELRPLRVLTIKLEGEI